MLVWRYDIVGVTSYSMAPSLIFSPSTSTTGMALLVYLNKGITVS